MRRPEPLRLSLTTGPAVEPLSLSDAKEQLEFDGSDRDDFIEALITSARQRCEKYTGRALITQTWTMYMDRWPDAGWGSKAPWWQGVRDGAVSELTGGRQALTIPKAPLQNITSIKTYDDSDTATTLASSAYYVDTATQPGRVVLRDSAATPTPTRVANGLEVVFVAGYGDAASDVPSALVQGMKMLVAHWFENREQVVIGASVSQIPDGVQATWRDYKLESIG
ncbi:head-tail connector protein [Pyruvatibacter mobilis]|uniref:head-tail connector protein n=1 Tax=Pyruvatibacter mobilis TaxID=1712261 RepID=UPI003BB0F2FD